MRDDHYPTDAELADEQLGMRHADLLLPATMMLQALAPRQGRDMHRCPRAGRAT